MAGISNEERHVIAASHHLLKALQSTNFLSNDARRLVLDLDIHLSTMMRVNDDDDDDDDEEEEDTNQQIETKLLSSRHTITSLHSKTWHSNPVILVEYLQAVAEVQRLVATLENMPLKSTSRSRELFDCAQSVVQMAMDRLQRELILTLVQNKQCFQHSLPIYEIVSNEDDSGEHSSMETEEYVMDLIHADVIPQIKSIADAMFTSGYSQEFYQSFTGFWRDTFSEHLSNVLANEHLSVEDVLHMEWKSLNSRIRRWRVAMKSMIGCYLGSAKCIFDQVLGGYSGHFSSSSCLFEASRAPILSLLNFGQAVALGPHKPEWLFCLLNMHEVLSALEPDVDALFETGSLIRIEFHELLTRIQDSIKIIFKELGNHIATCSSATPFTSGGIHHLTKYVVNYILCLAEYGDTALDFFLPNPVAAYLQSLTSILETNIENRSILYRDCALKHIFLMNNIHYIVQKISNSRIRPYFGDDWIRDHVVKYRQHAMWYERVTWRCIIMLLRDDGKNGKATLKARCRDFAAAFEELYKNQTKWLVPDLQLREDVRISASKILQAHRNFVKKITNSIGEKHIKYSEQELGTYILDLLEGSSKSLNHSRKR